MNFISQEAWHPDGSQVGNNYGMVQTTSCIPYFKLSDGSLNTLRTNEQQLWTFDIHLEPHGTTGPRPQYLDIDEIKFRGEDCYHCHDILVDHWRPIPTDANRWWRCTIPSTGDYSCDLHVVFDGGQGGSQTNGYVPRCPPPGTVGCDGWWKDFTKSPVWLHLPKVVLHQGPRVPAEGRGKSYQHGYTTNGLKQIRVSYFVTPRNGKQEIPAGCSIQQDQCDQLRAIERGPIQIDIPGLAACTKGTQQGDCYPNNYVETSGWLLPVAYTNALFTDPLIPLAPISSNSDWTFKVKFKDEGCNPCNPIRLPITEGEVFIDSNAPGDTPVFTHVFQGGTYEQEDAVTIPKETLQGLNPNTIHYLIVQDETPYPPQARGPGFRDSTNYGALFIPFAVS